MTKILANIETRILGIMFLSLILFTANNIKTIPMEFDPHLVEKLPLVLGYLLLISLFVERAIEMFLSAWRSEAADKKDLEIKHLNEKINAVGGKSIENRDVVYKELKKLEAERSQYSAKSRTYALWAGLIIGALISLIGIRTLNNIIVVKDLAGIQKQLFISVDILLTASVLAGGSEAINKLMKVYNSFMNTTIKKTN